ncbi:unnamed protein product [Penicillium viridicatum]
MATSSKIIYDETSGQMHISGFRFAYPDEPQEWQDRFFILFALALPTRNLPSALMPGIERNKADWREDENGWVW